MIKTDYTYEPFGKFSTSGEASTNSFKFTGREDDGTGLMYYRARYYNPTWGRFISEDPIGFEGGDANLYAYVGNSPCNATDPLGLAPWDGVADFFGDAWNGITTAGRKVASAADRMFCGPGIINRAIGGLSYIDWWGADSVPKASLRNVRGMIYVAEKHPPKRPAPGVGWVAMKPSPAYKTVMAMAKGAFKSATWVSVLSTLSVATVTVSVRTNGWPRCCRHLGVLPR